MRNLNFAFYTSIVIAVATHGSYALSAAGGGGTSPGRETAGKLSKSMVIAAKWVERKPDGTLLKNADIGYSAFDSYIQHRCHAWWNAGAMTTSCRQAAANVEHLIVIAHSNAGGELIVLQEKVGPQYRLRLVDTSEKFVTWLTNQGINLAKLKRIDFMVCQLAGATGTESLWSKLLSDSRLQHITLVAPNMTNGGFVSQNQGVIGISKQLTVPDSSSYSGGDQELRAFVGPASAPDFAISASSSKTFYSMVNQDGYFSRRCPATGCFESQLVEKRTLTPATKSIGF